MAAPLLKVAPNAFTSPITPEQVAGAGAAALAAEAKTIHDSIAAFGTVISSTAPGTLHRATVARGQIRRTMGLR
jgi:biotin carboxyl carrier protein